MEPSSRSKFVTAYSRLVADVWAEPDKERQLEADPRGFIAGYGLEVPDGVKVTLLRDVGDAEPDLDQQVQTWLQAPETGELILVVPALDPVAESELDEHELDAVVAGLDLSCACCCPCCCTT
ncbi:hypothetical protein [Jatrophihabitans sp.]|uniref:hypothetical protein n=1 Tax=Jatrophihabitans sp. TaxID=1932789 RepID=UPI002EFE30ED